MDSVRLFVGLDYHQDSVQVCVLDQDGQVLMNAPCRNDCTHIVSRVSKLGIVKRVAIESCTGAADLAEQLVTQAGWSVDLAHPGYVSRMKQNPDKTDYSDARLLADLVRVGYLPRVWLAPPPIRALRQLVRYRQQLANERRTIKLRIGALLREQRLRFRLARSWTQTWMTWLRGTTELSMHGRWIIDRHLQRLAGVQEELGAVERKLLDSTSDDAVVRRLLSMPGVGPVTAWCLRAEIGRFDRFNTGKQLARFCGLSPRNASSGTREADAGLIRAANRDLRAILIQAGHRLARHDERWAALALRMKKAGKPTNVIVAAVANRWMRWMFHQMQPERIAA